MTGRLSAVRVNQSIWSRSSPVDCLKRLRADTTAPIRLAGTKARDTTPRMLTSGPWSVGRGGSFPGNASANPDRSFAAATMKTTYAARKTMIQVRQRRDSGCPLGKT